MTTTKLTSIGDGLGVVLPPDFIDQLQGMEGDELKLIKTPKGVAIQRVDDETAQQIEIASEVMENRRDALRRLAE